MGPHTRRRGIAVGAPRLVQALELLVAAAFVKAIFAAGVVGVGPDSLRVQVTLTVALGLAFVWLNRHVPVPGARTAMAICAVGAFANAVVQLAHGGMVFSAQAARAAGYSVADVSTARFGYLPLHEGDLLGLVLGDVIPVPFLHRVLSVGDLALMAGLTLLARALASYSGTEVPALLQSAAARAVDHTSREEGSE